MWIKRHLFFILNMKIVLLHFTSALENAFYRKRQNLISSISFEMTFCDANLIWPASFSIVSVFVQTVSSSSSSFSFVNLLQYILYFNLFILMNHWAFFQLVFFSFSVFCYFICYEQKSICVFVAWNRFLIRFSVLSLKLGVWSGVDCAIAISS